MNIHLKISGFHFSFFDISLARSFWQILHHFRIHSPPEKLKSVIRQSRVMFSSEKCGNEVHFRKRASSANRNFKQARTKLLSSVFVKGPGVTMIRGRRREFFNASRGFQSCRLRLDFQITSRKKGRSFSRSEGKKRRKSLRLNLISRFRGASGAKEGLLPRRVGALSRV